MAKKNLNPNNEEYHGQLAGMKPLKPNQCGYHFHLKKTCPEIRGGCGWRRPKGDRTPICPKCGFDMRCERLIVQGYTVCQIHGAGAVKRGRAGGEPTNPLLRSPNLPHKLLKIYNEALADNEWLHLKRDTAILESFKYELIDRLHSHDATTWRQDLLNTWEAYNEARQTAAYQKQRGADNTEALSRASSALNQLGELITNGADQAQVMKDVTEVIERKSHLIAKEVKHLEASHKMIAVDRVVNMMDAVYQVILKRVDDPKLIKDIGGDLFELMNVDGLETANRYPPALLVEPPS